jgi:hypothetical protein
VLALTVRRLLASWRRAASPRFSGVLLARGRLPQLQLLRGLVPLLLRRAYQQAARIPSKVTSGRTRDLLQALLTSPRPLSPAAPFISDPRHWVYRAAPSQARSTEFVLSRLALPDAAAVVDLDFWLCPSTARDFNSPLATRIVDDGVPRGVFRAKQCGWRAAIRRMARAKLGRAPHCNIVRPRDSAGAFAGPKDIRKDRFLGERRPLDRREQSIGSCSLPYAPRLRCLYLDRTRYAAMASRDAKNFLFFFGSNSSRDPLQMDLGFRVLGLIILIASTRTMSSASIVGASPTLPLRIHDGRMQWAMVLPCRAT